MRLGFVSGEFINNDIHYNVNKVYKFLEKAQNDEVNMIFFGEAFLQGFDALTWDYNTDKNIAVSIDSRVINSIKSKVIESSVGIGLGFFELYNDRIYCSYVVFDGFGNKLCNYRRVSEGWKIKGMSSKYKEGSSISEFKYDDTTFKVALCGDLWNDNILDQYNNIKTDISLWPLYLNFDINNELDDYINRVNNSGSNVFIINSISKDPVSLGGCYYIKDGRIEDKLDINNESLLIVEV